MATTTTHYAFVKPDYSDHADIAVINSNMDLIDTALSKSLITPVYNVVGYGTVDQTGTNDSSAAFLATLSAIGSKYATLYIPSGIYRLSSSVIFPNNVRIIFDMGTVLQPDAGITVTISGPIMAEPCQIFSGSGLIDLGTRFKLCEVYPEWWGAVPNGIYDCTAAIQSAINAVGVTGGGRVLFSVPQVAYYCIGNLTMAYNNVVLAGTIPGPFDPLPNNKINGVLGSVYAPVISIGAGAGTVVGGFITVTGINCGIQDLLFNYPNQTLNTASTPIQYPATIVSGSVYVAGLRIRRCTFFNSYNAIDLSVGGGRPLLEDLNIGAYNVGIFIDHCYDLPFMSNIRMAPYWSAGAFPQTIDAWVLANGIGLRVARSDGLEVSNFFCLWKQYGIYLCDSPDTTLSPRCGYGHFSNVNIDSCATDINVYASQNQGYDFANLCLSENNGGQGLVLNTPGTIAPRVKVNNLSVNNGVSVNADVFQLSGYLTITNASLTGNATTYGQIIIGSTSAAEFHGSGIDFNPATTDAGFVIPNSWTNGRFTLTNSDLHTSTWTPPGTMPTNYRFSGNIGISDH
jgi:hypothetical protein